MKATKRDANNKRKERGGEEERDMQGALAEGSAGEPLFKSSGHPNST